jgi:hypothetical protein
MKWGSNVRIYTRLLMAVLVMACLAGVSWAAELSVSKGFGDVPWGADLHNRKGFMKLRTQEGIDYYVNMREHFSVQGFTQPTIIYGAVNGKLYATHVRLTGSGDFQGLAKSLTDTLGQAQQKVEDQAPVLTWNRYGVKIKLKDLLSGEVRLSFYYQPLAAKLGAAQREAEPGGTAELLKSLPAGTSLMKYQGEFEPHKRRKATIDLMDILHKGDTTGLTN